MNTRFLARLRSTPRIRKRDGVIFVAAFAVWAGIILARPWVIEPRCRKNPAACNPDAVLALDQPALKYESLRADQLSDLTQYIAGGVAAGVPTLWHLGSLAMGSVTPAVALTGLAADLVIFGQTAALNGIMTELVHWISQRPRPYVYASPGQSENPADYTSFYSGHTSFSATACMALLLVLLGRRAPRWLLVPLYVTSPLLVVSTASFRVLAGRHFLSDVMAGALAGTLVAVAVAYFHRESQSSS